MSSFLDRFKKKIPAGPTTPAKLEKKESAPTQVATVSTPLVKRPGSSMAGQVLLHPLVTEKITRLAKHQQVAFVVAPSTNKIEVRKAVEALYGVKPLRVQMISVKGKAVRFGRSSGQRKDWKKTIVTLPPGTSLESLRG